VYAVVRNLSHVYYRTLSTCLEKTRWRSHSSHHKQATEVVDDCWQTHCKVRMGHLFCRVVCMRIKETGRSTGGSHTQGSKAVRIHLPLLRCHTPHSLPLARCMASTSSKAPSIQASIFPRAPLFRCCKRYTKRDELLERRLSTQYKSSHTKRRDSANLHSPSRFSHLALTYHDTGASPAFIVSSPCLSCSLTFVSWMVSTQPLDLAHTRRAKNMTASNSAFYFAFYLVGLGKYLNVKEVNLYLFTFLLIYIFWGHAGVLYASHFVGQDVLQIL
jgi:hypothetical protein